MLHYTILEYAMLYYAIWCYDMSCSFAPFKLPSISLSFAFSIFVTLTFCFCLSKCIITTPSSNIVSVFNWFYVSNSTLFCSRTAANYRTNCYELFGCDVMLDSRLNPHLLEVNVSPSLMGSSPLDKKIKVDYLSFLLSCLLLSSLTFTSLMSHEKSLTACLLRLVLPK